MRSVRLFAVAVAALGLAGCAKGVCEKVEDSYYQYRDNSFTCGAQGVIADFKVGQACEQVVDQCTADDITRLEAYASCLSTAGATECTEETFDTYFAAGPACLADNLGALTLPGYFPLDFLPLLLDGWAAAPPAVSPSCTAGLLDQCAQITRVFFGLKSAAGGCFTVAVDGPDLKIDENGYSQPNDNCTRSIGACSIEDLRTLWIYVFCMDAEIPGCELGDEAAFLAAHDFCLGLARDGGEWDHDHDEEDPDVLPEDQTPRIAVTALTQACADSMALQSQVRLVE